MSWYASFVDLPNLSAAIYSTELCNRLRSFLAASPPPGPSTPVAELVIATSDFEREISLWGIRWRYHSYLAYGEFHFLLNQLIALCFSDIKGGVDSRELFHPYFVSWIQNTHNSLLTSCKLEKVFAPFVLHFFLGFEHDIYCLDSKTQTC